MSDMTRSERSLAEDLSILFYKYLAIAGIDRNEVLGTDDLISRGWRYILFCCCDKGYQKYLLEKEGIFIRWNYKTNKMDVLIQGEKDV
jgi:hypothetical protein